MLSGHHLEHDIGLGHWGHLVGNDPIFPSENVALTGTSVDYRQASREDPSVAAGWISDYINSGKWKGR